MIDPLHTLLAETLRYSDTFMYGYSQCCPLSEESEHISSQRKITAEVLKTYDNAKTKPTEVKCHHCGRLVSESVKWTCGCGRTTKPEHINTKFIDDIESLKSEIGRAHV